MIHTVYVNFLSTDKFISISQLQHMYVHDTFIRDNLIKILKQFLPNFEKAFSIDSFTIDITRRIAICYNYTTNIQSFKL